MENDSSMAQKIRKFVVMKNKVSADNFILRLNALFAVYTYLFMLSPETKVFATFNIRFKS